MTPQTLALWALALLLTVVSVALSTIIVWAVLDLARDAIKARVAARRARQGADDE